METEFVIKHTMTSSLHLFQYFDLDCTCVYVCVRVYIYKWVSKIHAMKSVICRVKSLHKTG